MKTPSHHPTDESLARYSAGTLDAGPRLVVAVHVNGCPHCRGRIRSFEAAGAALLQDLEPAALSTNAFARTLERLDQPAPRIVAPPVLAPDMPSPLRHYPLGPWRFVHPGLRWRRLALPEAPDANVIMLKVAAGQRVPEHGHTGTEYTQVMAGGFSDRFGHYVAGDCIEMDEDVDHQPVVDLDGECIVLAAVEGRLRLRFWLGRMFQPLIGI